MDRANELIELSWEIEKSLVINHIEEEIKIYEEQQYQTTYYLQSKSNVIYV